MLLHCKNLGRDVAEKLTSKTGLEQIDTFFERYGKNTILICRLLPFVSFDIVSYAAGLTSMSFVSFFVATGIGQLTGNHRLLLRGRHADRRCETSSSPHLLILFALSALIFMLRKIYMDRQSGKKKTGRKKNMETYYNPEDLAKFGTIGEKAPELSEKFFATTMRYSKKVR